MAHIDEWVIDVKRDLAEGRLDGGDGGSVGMPPIFGVPAKVREMNKKAFQPEVVSIGPYHHYESQAMEKHKRRALLHFLSRSNRTLEECLDLVRGSLPEIMKAYHNFDRTTWIPELFLKMILMDGCFILEILYTSAAVVEGYDKDDPIFGRLGRFYNLPSIRRDLLLIENQIPFFVLGKLFSHGKTEDRGHIDHLIGLLLEFLLQCEIFGDFHKIFGGVDLGQSLHILDLYRQTFFCVDHDGALFAGEGRSDYNIMKKFSAPKIPSAMALQDHGIIMRPHGRPSISFDRRDLLGKLLSADFRRRVLRLPALMVDNTTESAFLNAMVFESLRYPPAGAKVTSLVYLMSDLMVSSKDASLLSTDLGIIRNELGSEQALVDLFGRLSSADFLPDYRLFRLRMVMNEYCGSRRSRFWAYVNRTYFRNPWAQISVFSAIILFILTGIQAFYTVYPYYNKHNP